MKTVTFDELAALPLLQHYEKAFCQATRVSLKLLPPDEKRRRANLRQSENPFCALVASTPAGCAACLETQRRIEQSIARERVVQHVYCFAGLTDIAIPVMVGQHHVATLLSGQIFRRKPNPGDFEMVLEKIGGGLDKDWVKKARKAYFDTPVIPVSSLQGVIQLLTMFAQQLPEDASRHLMVGSADLEPSAVSSAKKFIESHSDEPITLEQVLQHVHVSRFHFCKIFKKTTGITFTEYVTRVRMEKAKSLLMDPSVRVSEVVFAAGFGSIPQFNSVFKRFVGMTPTEYRSQLRENSQNTGIRMADSADSGLPFRTLELPLLEEVVMADNIIRASAFQPDQDGPLFTKSLIYPGLSHHPRRAARA
jgi:AraC-like DNA-binding protein/ligand-binding sensor protein